MGTMHPAWFGLQGKNQICGMLHRFGFAAQWQGLIFTSGIIHLPAVHRVPWMSRSGNCIIRALDLCAEVW